MSNGLLEQPFFDTSILHNAVQERTTHWLGQEIDLDSSEVSYGFKHGDEFETLGDLLKSIKESRHLHDEGTAIFDW